MCVPSAPQFASAMPVVVRSSVYICLLCLCLSPVLLSGLSAPWFVSTSAMPMPMLESSAPLFATCFLII